MSHARKKKSSTVQNNNLWCPNARQIIIELANGYSVVPLYLLLLSGTREMPDALRRECRKQSVSLSSQQCQRSSDNNSSHNQKNLSLPVIIFREKLHMEKRQSELSDNTNCLQLRNISPDLTVDGQLQLQC